VVQPIQKIIIIIIIIIMFPVFGGIKCGFIIL